MCSSAPELPERLEPGTGGPAQKITPAMGRAFELSIANSSGKAAGQQTAQESVRQYKSVFACLRKIGIVLLIGLVPELVLVLHGNPALETSLQQDGQKLRPVEQTLARNAVAPPVLA